MFVILLFFTLSIPQEQKIVTCTVVEPRGSVDCAGRVFDVTPLSKDHLDEWELVAPLQGKMVNGDAPLSRQITTKGQQVKFLVEEDGRVPIASCEVRVWKNIKAWQQQGLRQGERPPFGLQTLPDDCQPWYGKN